MTLYKRIFLALALVTFMVPAAKAQFKNLKFKNKISCKKNSTKATLGFIPGAPNGTYSAKLAVDGTVSSDLTIDGAGVPADGVTKEFKIPRDESSGLVFDIGYNLSALQAMANFEDFIVPFSLTPGDSLTSQTGFGSTTGELIVSDEGCSGEDEDDVEEDESLEEGLEAVEQPVFETIDINDLVSSDKDLVVNVTYKVSAVAFALAVGNLKEGEDITDKAKKLAEKFSIKLDIKGLKKLAFKELRAASKGLKGEEKAAAEAEAKTKGLNKLLAEIKLKLPPLPKKDGTNKEEIKKIRKAKKKKILDALNVEVVEIKDSADESQKCLSFKITLPAKICANDDGSKTLVLAGQAINILNLEPGETFTVAIPVKVRGVFQEFFGVQTAARQRKGKKGPNGKTTIELTLINPVTE